MEEQGTQVGEAFFDSLGISGCTDGIEIGFGGFGVVYRAHQPAYDRMVAIKLLNAFTDDRSQERFERECRALGGLSDHPNIVVLHASGIARTGQPYMVMEYLPHGSFADRVDRDGPMPWAPAAATVAKVAGAVETAHRRKVLHRDIKPENILLSPYGEPKLADFGIARLGDSATSRSANITASIAHAPPEILDGKRATPVSDVYSLASSLFFLLTGHGPFVQPGEETIWPLIRRTLEDPVPDLRGDGIPDGLAAAIEQAMAKDPDDRHPSAEAFAAALSAVTEGSGQGPIRLAVATDGPGSGAVDLVSVAPPMDDDPPPVMADLSGGTDAHADTGRLEPEITDEDALALDRRSGAAPNEQLDGAALDEAVVDDTAETDVALADVGAPTEGRGTLSVGRGALVDLQPSEPDLAGGQRGRRRALVLGPVVVLLVLGAAVLLTSRSGGADTVLVPALAGTSDAEAAEELEAAGFEVVMERFEHDDVAEGDVIGTEPAPDTELEAGARVVLQVSSGPKLVDLPGSLVGMTVAEAEEALEALGLEVDVTSREDASVEAGTVIGLGEDQDRRVRRGSTVSLVAATSPGAVPVPADVAGKPVDQATAQLEGLGLAVERLSEPHATVPFLHVVRTQPPAGTPVAPGGTVQLVLSSGPAQSAGPAPATPTTRPRATTATTSRPATTSPPATSPPPTSPPPTSPPPTSPPPTSPPPTSPPTTADNCTPETPEFCS